MSKPNIYDLGFADRMNELMTKYGGSIASFAQKLDVTPPTVARWIKGEADPSRTNLIKIAEATGVSVQWLATGEESQFNKATETAKPYQPYIGEDAITVSQKRLETAIETLEEILIMTKKTMKPDGKVQMILALYELLSEEEPDQKQALIKIMELAA